MVHRHMTDIAPEVRSLQGKPFHTLCLSLHEAMSHLMDIIDCLVCLLMLQCFDVHNMRITPAADMYAFGVILAELIVGK